MLKTGAEQAFAGGFPYLAEKTAAACFTKENNLKPFDYLMYMFEQFPNVIRIILPLWTVCYPGQTNCRIIAGCLLKRIIPTTPDLQVCWIIRLLL